MLELTWETLTWDIEYTWWMIDELTWDDTAVEVVYSWEVDEQAWFISDEQL